MLVRCIAPALALLAAMAFALAPVPAFSQDGAAKAQVAVSKQELDQLLAPIALYPDDLLSNVLVAATYPLEVVQAARWIKEPAHAKLTRDALTKALEDQDWDPSVKALTQFPDVLAMMSDQLDWTRKLGDAFIADQAGVMDRVQFLRDKAEAAGHLKSNKHQTVTTRRSRGSEYILIEPAEPDIVYVPFYDPDVVYGSWWYPDYPPYYWPPAGGVYVDAFYWGVGIVVVPRLWGWSSPRWRRHYIHVNVRKYNRINVHRRRITSRRWRHDRFHRRGVRYHRDGVRARDVRRDRRHGRARRLEERGLRAKKRLGPSKRTSAGRRKQRANVTIKTRRVHRATKRSLLRIKKRHRARTSRRLTRRSIARHRARGRVRARVHRHRQRVRHHSVHRQRAHRQRVHRQRVQRHRGGRGIAARGGRHRGGGGRGRGGRKH